MKILVVGALSWNPERVRSLSERGQRLWGLWSRTMAWEQGPYAATDDCIRTVTLADAVRTIREERIDCVYSLFQVYDRSSWGRPGPGVEHDVWTLLRALLIARQQGRFDVPVVRHWGYDVVELDLDVVNAIDGHIFCNRAKYEYWTIPIADGGCGIDAFDGCEVVAFLDSDRPKQEFMHDGFSARLSDTTGEIHTVCVGRPHRIDFVALARQGIHVHVYGNAYDDVAAIIARSMPLQSALPVDLLRRYVHVHSPLQTIGAAWPDVRRTKLRWVDEFSRYDAGWSYLGEARPGVPLDDCAVIPNRLGTYLLAGLPIITDVRPGTNRYDELAGRGVNIDLVDGDLGDLRLRLEDEIQTRERSRRAVEQRHAYSFDATIDPLIATLERARESYFARPAAERTHFDPGAERRVVGVGSAAPPSKRRPFITMVGRSLLARRAARLDRSLRTS